MDYQQKLFQVNNESVSAYITGFYLMFSNKLGIQWIILTYTRLAYFNRIFLN